MAERRFSACFPFGTDARTPSLTPPTTAPVTAPAAGRKRRQMGTKIPHLALSAMPYAAPVTPPKSPRARSRLDRGPWTSISRSLLDALDPQREVRQHRRATAVDVQGLARDEAGLLGAHQDDSVADVRRCAETAHRRPAALVPVLDELEDLRWKAGEHAVVASPRTDRVHGDAALCERDGEVAGQRLFGGLGRTHRHPRLPAARGASRGIGDRDDPSILPDHRHRLAAGD